MAYPQWPPGCLPGTYAGCGITVDTGRALRGAHPLVRGIAASAGVPPARALRGNRVRVLIVEDEQVLADAIAMGLRRAAMAVDVAYDGAGALERTSVNDYDVVVLDRDIPQIHGDEVCRQLVASGST